MDAYPHEAWLRLGQHLKQRRPQIDPRYRIRKVFAEENGLTDKTVQEVENAYRQSFTPVMVSAIEQAYRLKPGNIRTVLEGGELEPAQPAAHVSQVELSVSASRPDVITLSGGGGPDISVDVDDTGEDLLASLGELTEREEMILAMKTIPLLARVLAIQGMRRGIAISRESPPPTPASRPGGSQNASRQARTRRGA